MSQSLYNKYVHNLCSQYVDRSDSVLDLGCGDGEKTLIVAKYSDNVMAGDLDDRTKDIGSISFRKIDPDKYGDESEFDVVTSFDVIEHIEDDEGFAKEVIRILKPGGIAIIGTPNRKRLSNRVRELIKGEIKYPHSLGYHYESGGEILHIREYTANDLAKLFEELGGADVLEVKSLFKGVYTPLGPVGILGEGFNVLDGMSQHLFAVVKKKEQKG
jgi:SAM-dependent methyltransferase